MKYHTSSKDKYLEIVKTLSLVTPFFLIFVSYLYLAIYYSFFDINIFNYLSVNTIILYAVKNIGLVSALAVLGYVMAITFDYGLEIIFRFVDWIVKRYSLVKKKILFTALATFVIIFVAIFGWTFPNYFLDNIFTNTKIDTLFKSAFTLFLAPLLIASPAKRKLLTLKKFTIGLVIITSILSIWKAYLDADFFIKNKSYRYVMGSDLKGDYSDEKIKLIGKADNHYFLKHPDKDPIIVKKHEDFKRLHIHTFKDTTGTK